MAKLQEKLISYLTIRHCETIFCWMKVAEHLPSDVNWDGEVTVADINVVIASLLTGGENPSMDVNGDGEVTVADVNAIIAVILGF